MRRSSTRHASSAAPAPRALLFIIPAALLLVIVVAGVFVIPRIGALFSGGAGSDQAVEAGQDVVVKIPDGSSGDFIAKALADAHVIDDPKNYYTAVKKLAADAQLKPGTYRFTTGQDPESVVKQLMAGPNVNDMKLTIPEGLTVDETAQKVQDALGISVDDFKAQAKASTYLADYPFLKNAYNDSLEGFLYPKTYTFTKKPTADEVIRALLDQFKRETAGIDLTAGANGLTGTQLIALASLVERETAVANERTNVASVIYNRLAADMPLQIDAAIVYARGGGSGAVTYNDLAIDSPYNTYKNKGLTPGPICSPSISSIKAAVSPAKTDYLYYVASSARDGSHKFTASYDEFLKYRDEYNKAVGQQ